MLSWLILFKVEKKAPSEPRGTGEATKDSERPKFPDNEVPEGSVEKFSVLLESWDSG